MNRMERVFNGREAGVTLIELIVGLTILAVLTAIASPSFSRYLRDTEVTTAQNDIVTALNTARTEALRRSMRVSVCVSENGETCAAGLNWSSGWLVFTDATGVVGTLDVDDELIQAWDGPAAAQLALIGGVAFVQYTPTGALNPAQAVRFDIHPNACPPGSRRLRVTVSPIGTIRNKREICEQPAPEED